MISTDHFNNYALNWDPSFSAELADIRARSADIESWFAKQWSALTPPAYASVDVRHAGYKMAAVDTNLFPAGYNNLSSEACAQAVEAWSAWRQRLNRGHRLALVPENHTRNPFYRSHLMVLINVLTEAGFEVLLATVAAEGESLADWHDLEAKHGVTGPLTMAEGGQLSVAGVCPDLYLVNHDGSGGIAEVLTHIPSDRLFPHWSLGWAKRLKSDHFEELRTVTQAFADAHQWDAWRFYALFDVCNEVNFVRRQGETCIVDRAQWLLNRVRQEQQRRDVVSSPFIAVKADAGTYGMGVMMIDDAEAILKLNRKSRVGMAKTKGAKSVDRVVLQEGVASAEVNEAGHPLEVVVYLVGSSVVGGFFRVHGGKSATDNLNAPGMTFSPIREANVWQPGGFFYLHGIVARLALLAAAREARKAEIEYGL